MSKITGEGCPNGVKAIAWYEWLSSLIFLWFAFRSFCKITKLDYGYEKSNCDISNLSFLSFIIFVVVILKLFLGLNLFKGKTWAHSLEIFWSAGAVLVFLAFLFFEGVILTFGLPFLISNLIILAYLNRPTGKGYFFSAPSQESGKLK